MTTNTDPPIALPVMMARFEDEELLLFAGYGRVVGIALTNWKDLSVNVSARVRDTYRCGLAIDVGDNSREDGREVATTTACTAAAGAVGRAGRRRRGR